MKNKLKIWAAALSLMMICTGCKTDNERPQTVEVSSSGAVSEAVSSSASSSSRSSGSASSSSGSGFSSSVSGSSSTSSKESTSSSTSSEESSSSTSSKESNSSSTSSEESSSSSTTGEESSSSSTSSAESSTTSGSPEPITPEDPVQSRLQQMSLREKVYQLFFVTPEQLGGNYPVTSPSDTGDRPVGGIIMMGANLETQEQTRNMLSKTQENAAQNTGIGVFLAVDEEGGSVARCAYKLGTTEFYGMAEYGARNDYDEAFYIGKTIGGDIRALGFNVDFAPVADVDISPTNELGDRIFSDDPEICANMVSGVVSGLNSSGVAATLKHFPGLGAEDGNTHTASSIIIDRTLSELRNEEFVPFRSGIQAGADFVMVGHQKVSSFRDDLPADLSYTAVTTMLRGELGFEGIAITDAQNMNTISGVYGCGTAAKMSIKAGIDMILAPTDLDEAANAVINAVKSGEISEERINESVTRILTVKAKMGLLS